MVPAMSSVIFGVVFVGLVAALLWWLLPWALSFLAAALVLGLGLSFGIQLWLGHRGACLRTRTLRWWLGPLGSIIDPLDLG